MARKTQEGRGFGAGISVRVAAWLAWALSAITAASVGCSVVLAFYNQADFRSLSYLVGVLSSALVGAFVASRRPRNPVGWLLLGGVTMLALQELTLQYAT